MSEISNNELHERDEETNALIPAIALALEEGDKVTVKNNKLYKIDPLTNALIPVVYPVGESKFVYFMAVPDYEKREALAGMVDTGNTWVADRDGFLRLTISNQVIDNARFNINGRDVLNTTGTNDWEREEIMCGISKGDVLSITGRAAHPAHDGQFVDYRAYFFPVKYVITQNAVTVLKKYTPYAGILMGQPDYANIETVNRISVTNATWTVDRDGYINVGVRRQNSTLMNEWINLYIDEKLVYSDFDRTNNTQSPDRYSNVLPVSKGDVIRIEAGPGTAAETLIYCYYIPPKAVPNLFVEGADLQTSSDIGKVNINPDDKTMTVNGEIGTGTNGIQYLINRPDLWANGVEIDFGNGLYGMRRAGTIPGTIAAGTVDTQVLLTVSDYTAFVLRNYGGSWDSGDGCLHAMIGLTNTTSFTSSWSSIWFVHTLTPAQLQLRTQAGAVRTNSPYDVWITYKK